MSKSADVYFPAVYRLNTYPLVHQNFLHAGFNVIALVPLLERFEAEHGTLLTGAMFAGRVYLQDCFITAIADALIDSSLNDTCRVISFD